MARLSEKIQGQGKRGALSVAKESGHFAIHHLARKGRLKLELFQLEFQNHLEREFPHYAWKWFDSIDSTNARCQELWKDKPCDRQVIIADAQTRGRGRYGRSWQSTPGVNIYLSIVWDNCFALSVGHLNLFWGVLIRETLCSLYPTLENTLTLKWPNDIYVGPKKLSGVLIQSLDQELKQVVVGMGINVYAASGQIPPTATSLLNEIGEKLGRQARVNIVSRLLKALNGDFITKCRLRPQLVIEKFARYAWLTREQCYHYHCGNSEIEGKLCEVFADGTVEVLTTSGKTLHLTT